jgi:hypothetical protein
MFDSGLEEPCPIERAPPQNPSGHFRPDERTMERFADGAGI